MKNTYKLASLLLIFCVTTTSCAAPKKANKAERLAGSEIHQRILSEYYVYTEVGVNEYVEEIGQKISQEASRQIPYDFIVLYSDKIFATSAPGGRVYVTTALLAFLENEAELAGVLAHEIGQLQYQHPDLSTKRKVANGVYQATTLAAPFFGIFGMFAMLGTTGLNAVASLEKTKQGRVEYADRIALNKMLDAGYDPQGLLDFIYRLVNTRPEFTYRIMDYYWSRPVNLDRIKKIKQTFRKLPLEGKNFTTNRVRFLERMKPVISMYDSPSTQF